MKYLSMIGAIIDRKKGFGEGAENAPKDGEDELERRAAPGR
jgi:hypothetical protein